MDARLRLLKRRYLIDGKPDKYIEALERLSSVGDPQLSSLQVAQDVAAVLDDLSNIIYTDGVSYSHGLLLVEKEHPSSIEGLSLAESTRDVAMILMECYGADGFKTWSAIPLGFNKLEEVIFSWEITL